MFRKFLQRDDMPRPREAAPAVSVVVIAYDMAAQAERTVRSLFSDYQLGVCAADYEVIVVENESRNLLDSDFVEALPDNFRYFLRRDAEPSPAAAINFGASQARGEHICIMIDGARMLTPGVMRSL
ncbi:MAG: glycosyltransferase, partial [Anaerolineae bacterium]